MTAIKTKADAEALINQEGVEYVSVRFTDLIGVQQHFTVPASEFLKDAFDEGMPFDGSSVEGFQAQASRHEARSGCRDRVHRSVPQAQDPEPCSRLSTADRRAVFARFRVRSPPRPRPISKATCIADTACFAPEAEFFIFDKVRFENSMQRSFYEVDSDEAPWNTATTWKRTAPEHRVQEPRQARLFPGAAVRPHPGSAR